MNHDCPKRSPWKCLGYNRAVHSFPSWSGMATSLMSFHKPCWLDFIFKLRVSDSVWTRTSVIFLSTPISRHYDQTHGFHCFAWVFRCVRIWINENNEAVDRRDNSWCILNRVLVFLLCSPFLLVPRLLWLLHIWESFSFRHVESDQWSFWELNGGNIASTMPSLEIRDVP